MTAQLCGDNIPSTAVTSSSATPPLAWQSGCVAGHLGSSCNKIDCVLLNPHTGACHKLPVVRGTCMMGSSGCEYMPLLCRTRNFSSTFLPSWWMVEPDQAARCCCCPCRSRHWWRREQRIWDRGTAGRWTRWMRLCANAANTSSSTCRRTAPSSAATSEPGARLAAVMMTWRQRQMRRPHRRQSASRALGWRLMMMTLRQCQMRRPHWWRPLSWRPGGCCQSGNMAIHKILPRVKARDGALLD